jgi:hypothetical protein
MSINAIHIKATPAAPPTNLSTPTLQIILGRPQALRAIPRARRGCVLNLDFDSRANGVPQCGLAMGIGRSCPALHTGSDVTQQKQTRLRRLCGRLTRFARSPTPRADGDPRLASPRLAVRGPAVAHHASNLPNRPFRGLSAPSISTLPFPPTLPNHGRREKPNACLC